MTKKKLNHPSFFKIMLGDFNTKLRVPPAFVKNIKHKTVSKDFTFSLRFGVVSSSWKVTVERSRDENSSLSFSYYFTRGWSEMVNDLQLMEGYFLSFYLVAKDAFEVAIFDQTGCARTFNNSLNTLSSENNGKVGEEEDDKVYGYGHDNGQENEEEIAPEEPISKRSSELVSKYPFFQVVITKSLLSKSPLMHVPVSFAKGNLNRNCKKQILTFETSVGGQSWPVTLYCNNLRLPRSNLGAGLSRFLKENFVEEGNICSFELVDRKKMVFRVNINRSNQYADTTIMGKHAGDFFDLH